MIVYGSKNGDQNIMCLKKIGVRPHNLLTIPILILNIIWDLEGGRERGEEDIDHLRSNFDDEKYVHINSNFRRKMITSFIKS